MIKTITNIIINEICEFDFVMLNVKNINEIKNNPQNDNNISKNFRQINKLQRIKEELLNNNSLDMI